MTPAAPHVANMAAYALATLDAPEGKRLISLAQNESFRPSSPKVVARASEAAAAAHLYPDPDWRELRGVLSDLHQISDAAILCGNGSMELIAALTQAYAHEGAAVLAPAHAYPFFRTAAQQARARFDTAPEGKAGVSIDALLDAVRPDTGLVFVANPGNPTGARVSRTELLRLRGNLPSDVLLVVDEAYGEFADHLGELVFDMIEASDTVVLRTFSKAYDLAGLRIGWGLFPPAIRSEVRKLLTPNAVSCVGQAAALATAQDQTYMRATCTQTRVAHDGLIARLRGDGVNVGDSFTNFALIRLGAVDAAQRAHNALNAEGIVARAQAGAGLPNCLRLTIADPETLDLTARIPRRWA